MSRIKVSQADIIESILELNRISFGLAESHVLLTTSPEEAFIPPAGPHWISVAIGSGVFDDPIMAGGVVEQCMEDATITISGHVRMHLDRANDDTELLINATRGLVPLKRSILQIHSGVDLAVNGNSCLRELLTPRSCTAPQVFAPVDSDGSPGNLRIGIISVTFGLMFDWELQA